MNRRHLPGLFLALVAMGTVLRAFAADTNIPPPVIAYLTPQEEAKTFFLQDGYQMELVLSDPIIKEPVLTVFDGNGRMFVAEMRSYMQDINGSNQRAKNGRVSVHWSSKHNGVYDKHAVYVDNILLPRMILPLADGIVINETDSDDFWLYKDTKHNGVADKKEMFHSGGPRGGNLEHQPSGLIWDLDNWLYITVDTYRLRYQNGNVISEPTPNNGAQWGMSQDDYGKPWIMNAGYEAGPVNFQAPFIYGIFTWPEQYADDYVTVYPLIGLADVQGGTVRFRPQEKSLNHFTAACGGEIYRGDRLPADLRGDFFFAEPVGRLIRRTKVEVKEGFSYCRNAYDKSEFIRSTDPDFRPVSLVNAPDGTLYITDMYRGIIQEKDWVGQGSYLRGVVEQYGMDKNIGRGRIWRVVDKSMKPGPQPHMLDESSAKLVSHLEHPNGWWRDTAQKLLVLRGDKSVVPMLVEMARSNTNHLARLHAMWTLEGLDALEASLVREKLKDAHPQVRISAMHAYETLYKKGDHSLVPDITALAKDADPGVVIQVMLTASMLKWPDWGNLVSTTTAANPAYGVKKIGGQLAPSYLPQPTVAATAPPPPPRYTADEKNVLARGEIIYQQLCFVCHAPDGRGTPFQGAAPGVTMAPPLGGSKTATGYSDAVISVVLKGLNGPVEGKNYSAQMVPMESNNDDWIASVISYVRNNFGNHSTFITVNEVARVRAAILQHTNAWTLEELSLSLPQPMRNRHEWKLTSSHNPGGLRAAIDGNSSTRWDSRTAQTPGMWVAIELPEATEIAGVDLDTSSSPDDYPRGYLVQVSDDGITWRRVAPEGRSTAAHNQILFAPVTTKFVRITQTGTDAANFWSIHELNLLKHLTAEELLAPPELFTGLDTIGATPAPAPAPPPRTPYTVE